MMTEAMRLDFAPASPSEVNNNHNPITYHKSGTCAPNEYGATEHGSIGKQRRTRQFRLYPFNMVLCRETTLSMESYEVNKKKYSARSIATKRGGLGKQHSHMT